jgi:squalene-hopene/tetraprenyl-beta-curcumene cyclase
MLLQKTMLLMILLLGAATARGEDAPTTSAVAATSARDAIERALPYLERGGVAWMQQKGCISCHNVACLIWSHNDAGALGLAVDDKKLAAWTDWSWKFSRSRRSTTRPLEVDNDGGGIDTLDQLLLGRRPRRDAPADAQRDAFLQDLRDLIVHWQQADGSWKAAGQLPAQHRPVAETNAVTTMWTILALATLDRAGDSLRNQSSDDAIQRALVYLKEIEPGVSTESLIVKLLVERRFGQRERADELVKDLLAGQRADGGWSWRRDSADSDAFATGQALYALSDVLGVAGSEAGSPSGSAPMQRGRDYLLRSQEPDGSWPVSPRAISSATNEGRLTRLTPIYQYWGTAWAVIGLKRTLAR